MNNQNEKDDVVGTPEAGVDKEESPGFAPGLAVTKLLRV
jgi:hypothetical protein